MLFENLSVGDKAFRNTVVILADKGTASAGESFIMNLHQLQKATSLFKECMVLGEKTAGKKQFSNLLVYSLPTSSIKLLLASSLSNTNFPQYKGEGLGIFPDYWTVSTEHLNETLQSITGCALQVP